MDGYFKDASNGARCTGKCDTNAVECTGALESEITLCKTGWSRISGSGPCVECTAANATACTGGAATGTACKSGYSLISNVCT